MKKHKFLLLFAICAMVLFGGKLNAKADSNNVYDLSEHQGVFTDSQVQSLKNEVPFVILRVQYGSAYADKTFQQNRDLLNKYGIPYGVYSYSMYESVPDAADEARTLYNRAPDAKFYVNDYETQSVTDGDTNDATNAWLQALRPLVGNRKILFYSYQSFMLKYAAQAISNYDGYWLAAYQTNEPSREHVLWQYTDKYYSPALNQYIDSSLLTVKDSNWFIGDNNFTPNNSNNTSNQSNNNSGNSNNSSNSSNNNSNSGNNSENNQQNNNNQVADNTSYYAKSGFKTLSNNVSDNFYNHVPDDNKYKGSSKVKYQGSSYAGKNVTFNSQAQVNGNNYYRCYYNGKLLGWIKDSSLGIYISYQKYFKNKTMNVNAKVNFYNHVNGSKYNDISIKHYGKNYGNKKMQIVSRAKKDGWKSYYYLCYYRGKNMGWIYQSAFK
ncbi:GH25 family lysozyme [Apilactobacillus xinyiensis]|uniref:GH25 family lysozyme n=1 Tax=Apilactobacillus xinyiensis TaxID=2841032 RepID=UPI003364B893